jgi:hypothetical protein
LAAIDDSTVPKITLVADAKFFPTTVTGVPTVPSKGINCVISGLGFSGSLQVDKPIMIDSIAAISERVLQYFMTL